MLKDITRYGMPEINILSKDLEQVAKHKYSPLERWQ